jgi:paraquat-inducible protein B
MYEQSLLLKPPPVSRKRWSVSWVWLVPIIAALVGISMVVHKATTAGPQIIVSFLTAEGLEANKTQVKYKNVVVGKVTAIALDADRSHVDATIELDGSAKHFALEDTRFWVVRPRIGANGISGVDTLLSGAFIGADAGSSEVLAQRFVGLETPPSVVYGQKGSQYTLHTDDLGSLDIGASVYYRRITVGQVVGYQLAGDGKSVDVQVFVNAPNDHFVTTDTRFWNASGVDISLSAEGLKLETQSVSSILAGGIAFVEPKYSPDPVLAKEHSQFTLFSDQATALAPTDGKSYFVGMRFDQPLRGLNVNAPVVFQGVDIGRVVSIDLDFDQAKQAFPTVVGAVIYPSRLGRAHEKMLGNNDPDDAVRASRVLGRLIDNGLRAQPRSGNLLTGQLYIALDFIPHASTVKFDVAARPSIIPTVPGSLDKLQVQLQAIVDKVSQLPLEQISNNLNGSLGELHETLQLVNGSVLPGVNGVIAQATKTLNAANESFAEDSPQRQQLGEALGEMQRTSRSVRVLTDFLSRHPESLIRGRLPQGAPQSYSPGLPLSRPTE